MSGAIRWPLGLVAVIVLCLCIMDARRHTLPIYAVWTNSESIPLPYQFMQGTRTERSFSLQDALLNPNPIDTFLVSSTPDSALIGTTYNGRHQSHLYVASPWPRALGIQQAGSAVSIWSGFDPEPALLRIGDASYYVYSRPFTVFSNDQSQPWVIVASRSLVWLWLIGLVMGLVVTKTWTAVRRKLKKGNDLP